jgi:hypothetical protein
MKLKSKILHIVILIFLILNIVLFNGCAIYNTFKTVYKEIDERSTLEIEEAETEKTSIEWADVEESIEKIKIREEEIWITSQNGEKIYAHLHIPNKATLSNKLPALILVQDGFNGSQEFDNPNFIFNANNIASEDVIVIHFDLEGTGESSGETDLGGYKSQDDLVAVINFIKHQPEVDKNKISILSFGTGVTITTGALARYPKINIRYLFDIEGAVNRYDPNNPLSLEYSSMDENFWKEREAINFIDALSCNYIRFQADNNQAENLEHFSHIVRYMNKATGGYPIHTQLNFAPPDTLFIEIQPEEESEIQVNERNKGSEDILNYLLTGEINNHHNRILNRIISILREGMEEK